ncbi:arginase family protein [Microbacterium karelineae]|uniref:arginase family protein n=1 Tax=Microbacterium karelineae TaxID=2654283 RepID=UPI0012EA118D|nr:arginase family protein [Microbacterium karelineae]
MARFVVVPQWQGSPSTRAMALIDGADAIAGDLPRASSVRVEVPYEAGESLDTAVLRASTIRRVSGHVRETLDGLRHERIVVVGGDCGVAVPAIGHVAGDDLAVVWFDAHGDLHSPDTSPSGAFAGMALRAVLGGAPDGLGLAPGMITPDRVVLAGARELDPAEDEYVRGAGAHHLPADEIAQRLADALAATGARRVYVHIDLDVLDPAHMSGVADAQPFGLEPSALVDAIVTIRRLLPLAGASISGFAPRSPDAAVDDMGAILRIIGALAKD